MTHQEIILVFKARCTYGTLSSSVNKTGLSIYGFVMCNTYKYRHRIQSIWINCFLSPSYIYLHSPFGGPENTETNLDKGLTSSTSRAYTIKLWLSALATNSPLGRLWHCLLSSSSIPFRFTPSPAITRTTWLSGPCSAWKL